jgi:formamidopyrimidine-DNA glycosylase
MPELPEVETSRAGIRSHILHQGIKNVIVRQRQLRWPIPIDLKAKLINTHIQAVERRGKYLILKTEGGSLIIHLGMSGHLAIVSSETAPTKHAHVDILFNNNECLRYTDPRRFGSFLWTEADPLAHPLLRNLGPEPLSLEFNSDYLWQQTRSRKQAIKQVIMNSKIVVGVGNIYANEVLFAAKIHPKLPAQHLSKSQCTQLVKSIKTIIDKAIRLGGTTLKDFRNSQGKPGYFKQELKVYGRGQQACTRCQTLLCEIRLGQRTTVFCPSCQRLNRSTGC